MGLEDLKFEINEEWAKHARDNPHLAFVPMFAEGRDGTNYMKGKGRSVPYKIVSEDGQGRQTYECGQCSGEILGATVAHPVHDGLFPLSGSGEVKYETVPYCPKCEEEPSFHGSPMRE